MDNGFIAPVVNPRSTGPNKFLVLGGIAVFLIVVLVGFFMIFSSSSGPNDMVTRANARMGALNQMVASGKEHAEHPDLRKVISEASLLLIGDVAAFKALTTEVNEQITAEESEATLLQQLETAAVNGQFDESYVPVLIEKYEDTNNIMELVLTSNISADARQTTEKIIAHNEAMLVQLNKLTL